MQEGKFQQDSGMLDTTASLAPILFAKNAKKGGAP